MLEFGRFSESRVDYLAKYPQVVEEIAPVSQYSMYVHATSLEPMGSIMRSGLYANDSGIGSNVVPLTGDLRRDLYDLAKPHWEQPYEALILLPDLPKEAADRSNLIFDPFSDHHPSELFVRKMPSEVQAHIYRKYRFILPSRYIKGYFDFSNEPKFIRNALFNPVLDEAEIEYVTTRLAEIEQTVKDRNKLFLERMGS